ncbi:MAG: HAD family acid phosphatase [Kofleriaceae bacterium]|nr:HAD family acid phosphatase [Kofleriaceae bacterium]
MRKLLALFLLSFSSVACTDDDLTLDGAADIQGADEKADGTVGIEVTARIRPGTVDGNLSSAVPRRGYVFYAMEGTRVSLEVMQAGTSTGLDTVLKVYGPRLADGSYPKTIATDEDSGYGKLSKLRDVTISTPGFYLVEMSFGSGSTPADGKHARLKLSCTGTCDSELPVDTDLGLTWYRRSAERRALTAQAYALATSRVEAKVATGVGASWGVVLDIDETTLNNSQYQQERMNLGLGYSPASWTAWVERKAATPLDGVLGFTRRVKELGGKVVFVTNRAAATECAPTIANLDAAGIPHDGVFCKTTTSDKNPRFGAVKSGTADASLPPLEIVLFVGDNIQDFPLLTQDVRTQAERAFDGFGRDFVLLPNSMYGSWEKNAGDNAL